MVNKKILGKAHIRRRFFVVVGKSRSPTPIKIGTGRGMKDLMAKLRKIRRSYYKMVQRLAVLDKLLMAKLHKILRSYYKMVQCLAVLDKLERRGRARFNKLVEFIEQINVFSYMVLFDIVLRIRAYYGNRLTSKQLPVGSEQSRSSEKREKREKREKSYYSIHLEEKQKLRFHYGLPERQLQKYVCIAGKAKGSTGQVLLQLLEMRLDNILFRLGMAVTIPQARQLVNHRHILVNGRIKRIKLYARKNVTPSMDTSDDGGSGGEIFVNDEARRRFSECISSQGVFFERDFTYDLKDENLGIPSSIGSLI
ncbi:hypothetical protein RYX36_018563 [Vicia faba]